MLNLNCLGQIRQMTRRNCFCLITFAGISFILTIVYMLETLPYTVLILPKVEKHVENPQQSYEAVILDLTAKADENTKELPSWALWGVGPFFRVSPSPSLVVSFRNIDKSVCWAFSGSKGKMRIYLPHPQNVKSISVEHVRPDRANSAPKKFKVYGMIYRDIETEICQGEYRADGPPKQFFKTDLEDNIELQEVVFAVLSNHGNEKYTCLYKVLLYTHDMDYIHY